MFDRFREHLANERTFLARIWTSIALIALGFVIVRFTLFLKQISLILKTDDFPSSGFSSVVGIIMVIIGVIIAFLSVLYFAKYKKQLDKGLFYSSSSFVLFIALVIIIGGLILAYYLISIV